MFAILCPRSPTTELRTTRVPRALSAFIIGVEEQVDSESEA